MYTCSKKVIPSKHLQSEVEKTWNFIAWVQARVRVPTRVSHFAVFVKLMILLTLTIWFVVS